jgi:hypothetical protein
MTAYPVKTGYLQEVRKSWKKGRCNRLVTSFICKMIAKGYFEV